MTSLEVKAELRSYLRGAREVLVWKLDERRSSGPRPGARLLLVGERVHTDTPASP